eukprot:4097291-Alexandrium_andersonii.AAC.1
MQAISGATWLGPDPRAALADAERGLRVRVPESWGGPEDSEMIEPLPFNMRQRDVRRAGTSSRTPQG